VDCWLVIPARGRTAVTRLCFAELAWLQGVLLSRGVACRPVVVADDENVDVAAEHGFDVLEVAEPLGGKVNAGFAYALEQGADYVAFSGSDDWLHPDLFDELDGVRVRAGKTLCVVDLERGRLRHVNTGMSQAVPWLIPAVLAASKPLPAGLTRGSDFMLRQTLPKVRYWDMWDPHGLCRVDFKTDTNMTPYAGYAHLSRGEQDAWETLSDRYPARLVEMAATCELREPVLA
jgi:hypothetical protein